VAKQKKMKKSGFRILVDRVNRARVQFPEYKSALSWLLLDLFHSFPWIIIKITSFSLLGATLRGVTLAGAIKYIHILEKDRSFTLVGIDFMPREWKIIILATFLLFLLMSISAWLLYRARVVVSGLISSYQECLLKRILGLFGPVVPDQRAPKDTSGALKLISGTVARDAQRLAMVTRFLGQSLSSLVIFMYGFPIILYIDPLLTLLLIGLVVVFLPLFYRANVMAYRSNLMARRSGSGANQAFIALMEDVKDFQGISIQHEEEINNAFKGGDLKEKLDALPFFLRSKAMTEFWSNILLGLSVSLVVAVQVPEALFGDMDWSLLIAYVIFLKLTVTAFKNVMSFLTKFSRFYPFVRRYQRYVESARVKKEKTPGLVIKSAIHGVSEKRTEFEVHEPTKMALITGTTLSRYTFPYMARFGTGYDNGILVASQDCSFIGSQGLPQRDGSLRNMLNLPENYSVKDLSRVVHAQLFETLKENVGLELDKYLGQEEWRQFSLMHRTQLGLVAGMLNPARVMVIDRDVLLRIPETVRKTMLYQLNSKKTLTIITYPETVLYEKKPWWQFNERLCGVVGGSGDLIALGSPVWMNETKEDILKILAAEQSSSRRRQAVDAVTEEEFEDFDED
jgi:hypothetical protein